MTTPQIFLRAALLLAPFALGGCGGTCWGHNTVCSGYVWYPEAECWTGGDHPPVAYARREDVNMMTVDDQGYCWIVQSTERPDWGPPGATLEEACPPGGRDGGPSCLDLLGYYPEI